MEDSTIMKSAGFVLKLEQIYNKAQAGVSKNPNPLLTWVQLIFADDEPNANSQGIKQEEFASLIDSMKFMPIKACYTAESGLGGHDNAVQIGVITEGQQQGNKIVAIGALYNDEYPEIVEFFKEEIASERPINFSWRLDTRF
jgi:hypothetical protein